MKKNYKILSESEVGYGVLIESDSGSASKWYKASNNLNESLDKQEVESDNGVLRILVDCILQKANTLNRNGRIYPKHVLEKEVNKYLNNIKELNSFGQADHADNPTISLKRDETSHIIRKVWWDGDTLYGTLELITSKIYATNGTICCIGDHIANLLERGYKIGISSRGVGSVKTIGGRNMVQNDFELICWDLVSSPSTPDAYLAQGDKSINESYNGITNEIIGKKDIMQKFIDKNKFL